MGRPTYIAVAGNIGCGKSSLVDFICKTYKIAPFFEPNAANPYLADFYGDMKKWAFHSQLYFITYKFGIHMELDAKRSRETVVQDRTIFEDAEIFAKHLRRRGFIEKRDWAVYEDLYRMILQAIHPPDLMIYLRASVRTMRKRIKMRGRPEEQNMPLGYLRSLDKLYEEWRASYKRSPVVVIDTDRLDYITDMIHRIDVLKTIEKYV